MRNNISDIFQPTGKYSKWSTYSTDDVVVSVCGHAHYDHGHYYSDAFARIIADSVCGDWDMQIRDILKRLNGNWALVVLRGDILYAVTDRMRSFPLLYNELNGDLCLTDDFERMCRNGVRWCSEGIEEFLWSGYPADTLTLADGVYQIPAGMFLRYDVATKEKSLTEYFSFLPRGDNSDSDGQLSERLATLLDESVRRVGEAARGKIVVPLSGGMDSRVIAATFKRNGFDNVVCFSYGKKGNPESAASKSVAEALNYEWHFVEYSPTTWSECMFSKEMKDYLAFACNGCSMPVYSNWYAVKSLCERSILSPGDAFVPGHTGDFLTGGHIPSDLFVEQSITPDDILSLIMKKHFSRWSDSPPDGIRSRLSKNALAGASGTPLNNIEAAHLCEIWNWKERQAKMIVNSNRIYEYFGFPWFIPLWDAELTDFYLTVPFKLRCNRKLFIKSSVEHIFSGKLSILADIPLVGRKAASPKRTSILVSQVSTPAGVLHKVAAEVRRRLIYSLRLVHLNHALCLRDCFAAGHNHLLVTIRKMLQMQGLGRILNKPECASVVKFVDRPVGQVNAYATLSLFVLAQLCHQKREFN